MKVALYNRIASLVVARRNCIRVGNDIWLRNHSDALDALAKDHLPSGSGFDAGTRIDMTESKGERLVLTTSFHHMDDHGSYCGWSNHRVIVTASLTSGFDVRVTGKDRRNIKEFIGDTFWQALGVKVDNGVAVGDTVEGLLVLPASETPRHYRYELQEQASAKNWVTTLSSDDWLTVRQQAKFARDAQAKNVRIIDNNL